MDTHDFPDAKLGKAIPYGVYDLANNDAWVSVGIDHDTAEFAVASIAEWWKRIGRRRYPSAKRLLITGDSGGSNGHRNRLWKVELQGFANRTGLIVEVCHFPLAPANGTRLSTGCSVTLLATGKASPWKRTRSW